MTSPLTLVLASSICAIGTYACIIRRRRSARRLSLPPGLPKLPLIGNLLDLPRSNEWVTYERWCRELDSDIIHLEVIGKSIIIVNSLEAATDLLEKRSSIYSGRPQMTMGGELMGWNVSVGVLPYGDEWRLQRKFLHGSLNATDVRMLQPYEIQGTHSLIRRLLEHPHDIAKHLKHWAGDIILRVTYGIEVQEDDDPYIAAAESAVRSFVLAAVPGAYLVDALPFLKYVPKWMPGAGFKTKAEQWRIQREIAFNAPFQETERRMAAGDSTRSFTSLSLRGIDLGEEESQRNAILNAAGGMFGAGTDTTVSAILSCILAMLEDPAVLRKAQEQVDSVVGTDRLPSFGDLDQLPYVTAMAKESLRWRPVAPIALPHLAEKEDTYRGYCIPANSIIVPNAWAMLHNEMVYPDPTTFRPERFLTEKGELDPSVLDPAQIAFGFGRRICPGRFMAFSSIWLALATLVATFNIKKAVDSDGNDIPLTHEYIDGVVVVPAPFECSITPRSAAAERLIRDTAIEELRG